MNMAKQVLQVIRKSQIWAFRLFGCSNSLGLLCLFCAIRLGCLSIGKSLKDAKLPWCGRLQNGCMNTRQSSLDTEWGWILQERPRKTHLSNIDVRTETVHMVSSPALGHSIFSWLYTNIVYLQPWLHSANRETCSSGILHDFATMNLLPNCAYSSLESWRSLKYFSAGTCWVLNLQPCTSSSPRWGLCCLDSSVSRWLDRF